MFDKPLKHKTNWIQHVQQNVNRLTRPLTNYRPPGSINRLGPLERLLDE
jgi:hypothetical protein